MPWKVSNNCVHRLNADGSLGKVVPGGCHANAAAAQAHKRALYANVKEKPMSKAKKNISERELRRRAEQRARDLQKEAVANEVEDDDELTEAEEAALLELEDEAESDDDESEEDQPEEVKKSYFGGEYNDTASIGGPVTFEQLDEIRAAQEKAEKIREMTWDVQELVRNIVNTPALEPPEKATYIKTVGADFGSRVAGMMDTPADMLKETDLDLLQIEAMLAQDERSTGILEKTFNYFQKKDLSSQARKKLPDSAFALPKKRKYPIHDKAHVRNALARAAQQIKAGGEGAADARAALPKIRAAARKFGIGVEMKKESSGILIQKDAKGDWRWVGWPSNNFIDRSKDILTEAAHLEYVDWWNKEKPDFPVFTSMHAPGTARTYPVDFVGFQNGFLVMSGKLTESEAAGLLEIQKEYDLGMSHTGWGIRDLEDIRQIQKYRIFEVTDLPIDMADNTFTDLSVIVKEAEMNEQEQLAYLTKLLGDEAKAKEVLSEKTSLRQKELQGAGVEQKEKKVEPESAAAPDLEAIIKAVGQEFDMEGLSLFVKTAQEAMEKVPVLEQLVQKQQATITKLGADTDEQLAELLQPKVEQKFAWSKARPTESDDNLLEGDELEKAKAKVPGIPEGDEWWLSQSTGIEPVKEAEA